MSNGLKTWIYLLGVSVVILFVGSQIGGRQGLLGGFLLALGMVFTCLYFGKSLILWTHSARLVEGSDPYKLNSILSELCHELTLAKPEIYLMPTPTANAFAIGRGANTAAIVVTEGLVSLLSPEELKGVLAQQLALIQNRYTFTMEVAAVLGSLVMYVANSLRYIASFGKPLEKKNPSADVLVGMVAPVAAALVHCAVSRNREFAADSEAVDTTQDPQALAQALWKIHHHSKALPLKGIPSMAHLFIVNPLGDSRAETLFQTHPPIDERIKKLIGRTL